ncbi:hypothetical protein HDU67_000792 [Dinochytrium kinnereticum]|nr:hypothetical protein HDU67_000792 [Dinochytrium kinnereticum]
MAPLDEVVIRAPAKVILFGEHAVKAIAASLGLYTYARIKASSGTGLELNFPDVNLDLKLSTESIESLSYSSNSNRPSEPVGLNETQRPNLEKLVKDLASDSAKQAAIAAIHLALCILDKLVHKNKKGKVIKLESSIGEIQYDKYGEFKPSDLDLINRWAFISEQVIHGNPSGIDNTICTYGGASVYAKGFPMKTVEGLSSLKFLLTNTMVPKNTKAQVDKVRSRLDEFPLVISGVLQSIDGISQTCIEIFANKDLDEKKRREQFKILIEMNHQLLSTCGMSHPEIEKVRRIASLFGFASKLTGAGGGGCVLSFINNGVASYTVETAIADLRSKGFQCYSTSIACNGVRVGVSKSIDGDSTSSTPLSDLAVHFAEKIKS